MVILKGWEKISNGRRKKSSKPAPYNMGKIFDLNPEGMTKSITLDSGAKILLAELAPQIKMLVLRFGG